jgi:hypothetical protein
MKSEVYSGVFRVGLLDEKVFAVRDHFQYYTTGIEKLVIDDTDHFSLTTRETGERPEVIMNSIFKDENLADLFVAINNQAYLWGTPFDLDNYIDVLEFRMKYMKLVMRDRIVLDIDPEGTQYYNDVGEIVKLKVEERLAKEDEAARLVFIPKSDYLHVVKRKIKKYLESRVVK